MNKKKALAVAILTLCSTSFAFAGGILTNTNQSARFARLMALEATTTTDAAYYNPAGTIKLAEGFHFSFSNQSAFQERIINSTYSPYKGSGGSDFKQFKGTASAPIIPSLQAVYRKGNWALSGNLAVVGGGGKATFNDGISMFEAPIAAIPPAIQGFAESLSLPLTCNQYAYDTYMTGTNYIFGGQIGGTYKINDMFSVYAGFRLNIVHNKYEGYIRDIKINPNSQVPGLGNGEMVNASEYFTQLSANPMLNAEQQNMLKQYAASTADKELNSKQSGWGVAPILGVHFSYKGLNIGAKYEFRTSLNVENKTQYNKDAGLDSFKDGVNTAHDVPAYFTIGASYDIIAPLTVNVGYHHFFDKDADMAGGKQKHLTGGTNEYLAGVEYRINPMFLVSMGGQITRYGLADGFQSDLSFSVNSYSLGFGGAVNVSKNVQINVGYFYTDYSDYKMADVAGSPSTSYTRKNKVFTAGVDFSF
ncbi:aromatic hydrocarbon degradation protein [Dysgonomonas sp. 521]|uniref:OmpP1/FadL family transporter n=1 Tax=Dysgonomonas sp. 521 TaxID=2302932 RepID=UPI0013D3F735|nr:aromatic hydrocarbon degradation protein [Dysgonomonas sp. 521]NDV95028.1 aromatic hydrocarbon degradation protein [Dysgonomonas sp. 521]